MKLNLGCSPTPEQAEQIVVALFAIARASTRVTEIWKQRTYGDSPTLTGGERGEKMSGYVRALEDPYACDDCGADHDDYTVTKELWQGLGLKFRDNLCLDCLTKRLGRRLTSADLVDKPITPTPEQAEQIVVALFAIARAIDSLARVINQRPI